mgnify:CR=1 FL=1
MSDLGNINQKVEGLVDTRLKILGMRFTPGQLIATFALISTIASGGYGLMLTWQKVEALSSLDLGEIAASMQKTSEDLARTEEVVMEVRKDLKQDIRSLTDNFYSLESRIDKKIISTDSKITSFDQKMDSKLTSYDDKIFRFEDKVDKFKESLEEKIQIALDNPLAY